MVEKLYDPMFVPESPCREHDPEKVKSMLSIQQKSTRTAPEVYNGTLAATFGRYEKQQRRPPISELTIPLQNFEQLLALLHVYISAILELTV